MSFQNRINMGKNFLNQAKIQVKRYIVTCWFQSLVLVLSVCFSHHILVQRPRITPEVLISIIWFYEFFIFFRKKSISNVLPYVTSCPKKQPLISCAAQYEFQLQSMWTVIRKVKNHLKFENSALLGQYDQLINDFLHHFSKLQWMVSPSRNVFQR